MLSINNKEIGERFKNIRLNLKYSQKDLAELLEIHQTAISDIEKGKTNPSFNIIKALSLNFKDLNIDWLLTGRGDDYIDSSFLKSEIGTPKKVHLINEMVHLSGEKHRPKNIDLSEKNIDLSGKNDIKRAKKVEMPSGVPLLPFDAFAGVGSELLEGYDFASIEERYEVPLFKGLHIDFMIPVKGSSMYPKYASGDVVACRLITELLYIQWNKTYVLDTITNGTIIKKLKPGNADGYVLCISHNTQYDPFEIPLSDVRNIALIVGVIRLE